MIQKFKTKRLGLILLGILLYSLGAYITLMEKGLKSLPALTFFALFWSFFLASGWNDVYLHKSKIVFKNYIKFWQKNSVFYFTSIDSFDITEGSRHYYNLIIFLKDGGIRKFAISNQIDPHDLIFALKEQGLKQKI